MSSITLVRILFLALFIILSLNGKMMLWLMLFALSLVLAFIFGRVYCGYICPLNTLMIPVDSLSKKLKIQTNKIPKWLSYEKLPWIFLVLSIAIMILGKKVFHKNIPILLIWLVVSLLVALRYKPAIFHNFICPFGVLQKVSAKLTRFSKSVNKQNCIGCRLCEKVCPSEAISVNNKTKKALINTEFCFQCINCEKVCPQKAIQYSKIG